MSFQHNSSDHQTFYTPVDANPEQQLSLLGFEGPEKLIEVWFKPPQEKLNELNDLDLEGSTHGYGLRTVEKEIWDDMLTVVRAQVLSVTSNQYQDAYLLSESSMFVSPYRFMIKTCGTTTLLNAVPKILDIAKQHCGLDTISAFFYSRKCFMFPDRQERPHGSWDSEVDFLEKIFPECKFNTSAYVVGKLNRDHWNLFMATPYEENVLKYTNSIADLPIEQFNSEIETLIKEEVKKNKFDNEGISEDDFTLEILMSGLDQKRMVNFWRTEEEKREVMEIEERGDVYVKGKTEERVYEQSGLKAVFPQAQMDHYVFNPCGYSSNALLGEHYYSVHVTPEDICSYASFECNLPLGNKLNQYKSYNELIYKVLNIFNPEQFVITLFTRKPEGTLGQIRDFVPKNINVYKKMYKIIYDLNKWNLAFCQFTRNDIILKRIKESEDDLSEEKMMRDLALQTENMALYI
jgi:S-adenosylmethionine decarboxylase